MQLQNSDCRLAVYHSVNMSTDDGDLPRRASIDGGINLDHPDSWTVISPGSADPLTVSTPNDPIRQVPSKSCAFWNNFLSFVPEPAAPFVDEFNRLAKHRRWRKKEKREYLAKALTAEIDFHSDKSSGLVRWKRLCQEVRVGSEPESITKCKKVSPKTLLNHLGMADAV